MSLQYFKRVVAALQPLPNPHIVIAQDLHATMLELITAQTRLEHARYVAGCCEREVQMLNERIKRLGGEVK